MRTYEALFATYLLHNLEHALTLPPGAGLETPGTYRPNLPSRQSRDGRAGVIEEEIGGTSQSFLHSRRPPLWASRGTRCDQVRTAGAGQSVEELAVVHGLRRRL